MNKTERIKQGGSPIIGFNIRRLREQKRLRNMDMVAKLQLEGMPSVSGSCCCRMPGTAFPFSFPSPAPLLSPSQKYPTCSSHKPAVLPPPAPALPHGRQEVPFPVPEPPVLPALFLFSVLAFPSGPPPGPGPSMRCSPAVPQAGAALRWQIHPQSAQAAAAMCGKCISHWWSGSSSGWRRPGSAPAH